jgi:hypothetical protein
MAQHRDIWLQLPQVRRQHRPEATTLQPRPGDTWYLDEVRIDGQLHYL